jgi:hypothetical protein
VEYRHPSISAAKFANPATWTTVTNTPGVVGGNTAVLINPASQQKFFQFKLVQ